LITILVLAVCNKPELKDLCNTIVPKYAAKWKHFLGIPSETLDIIEYDNLHKATDCCRVMFAEWLESDPTASSEQLEKAIKSISKVSIKNAKEVLQWYYRKIIIEQPKISHKPVVPGKKHQKVSQKLHFSKVAFLLHENKIYTENDVLSVANVPHYRNITVSDIGEGADDHLISPPIQLAKSYYQQCNIFTDIFDIIITLSSDEPFMLLLEGGPGMGKTTI